jgi:DNA-binding LytR/AlgR family response regulator
VTRQGAIDCLKKWRGSYSEAQLLLIADAKMSPMEYLKPGILASSLLLRPWREEQAKEVLEEFVLNCVQERGHKDKSYVIESRDGTLNIPYDRIYFFEAREKKIFVCTGKEEYSFYHTIDKLEEELPEQFIRCHRGFIVNSEKIRKIMLSQNIIYLSDGFDVPLSRSYKSVLKEFGK